MSDQRPPIPDSLKREIRQRCYFGCIFCGNPIYQFHHIRGYASTHEHKAEDITLLCGSHHDYHTRGWLPDKAIRKYDQEPYNKHRPATSPHPLYFSGEEFAFSFGTCEYIFNNRGAPAPQIPLLVDGLPLIKLKAESSHILISLVVLDEKNRIKVKIVDNELVAATSNWDVEFEGTRLTIRDGQRQIPFDCQFKPPSSIEILTASLWCNGYQIVVTDDGLLLPNGSRLARCRFHNSNVAVAVQPPATGCAGIALAIPVPLAPHSDFAPFTPTGVKSNKPNSPVLVVGPEVSIEGLVLGYIALCDPIHGYYDPDMPG